MGKKCFLKVLQNDLGEEKLFYTNGHLTEEVITTDWSWVEI